MNYSYDALYRLTNEAIIADPVPANNGSISYGYDPVSNRLSRTSTLAAVSSATSAYDANDRLAGDGYDANGDTTSASGAAFAYDFEHRIKSVNNGAVTILYDGDGNRVAKTAGGVTTKYLVDDLNPTGFAQVVEETVNGSLQRVYTYGNALISQSQLVGGNWTASFYGYDGHGNVRFLTDARGAITDRYDYDGFGNLISSSGGTPNNYLYGGQQYDADAGGYYMRARYYSQQRGRFLSMDSFPGLVNDPISLHKYLYANADPVNLSDPSGLVTVFEKIIIETEYSFNPKVVIALSILAAAVVCVLNKAADALRGGTESDPINPCILRKKKCEDEYPEYKRCDELPGNYIHNSSGAAFNQILREMRDLGYDTKGLRKDGGQTARGGPCARTPGALHYDVKQGKTIRGTIGECQCCEEAEIGPPVLRTRCAILSRYY